MFYLPKQYTTKLIQYNMTTEYERLGGFLPEEIEEIVKAYSRPRYMKPKHCKMMKECIENDNGYWWAPPLESIYGDDTDDDDDGPPELVHILWG